MSIFEDEENPDIEPAKSQTPDPLDQTTDLQKDKIFNNNYKPDSEGSFKKLNKLQINEVYSFTAMQLPNFSRIKMFSILQEYFDVNSNKFYDSLSNTFKKELVEELRADGYLEDKLGGPLFQI